MPPVTLPHSVAHLGSQIFSLSKALPLILTLLSPMVAINKLIFGAIATTNALSLIPSLQQQLDNVIEVFALKPEQKQDLLNDAYNLPGKLPGNDERPIPGDSPLLQCDVTEPQLLNLQSVIIEPNPPVKGANLTIVAKGYLAKDIVDGAYVEVDVRYGFIKLVHETFDICEEITKVDMECPVKAGQQIVMKEVEIPAEVPPGKYTVVARAYTKDDEFITCLSGTVEFPAA